MPDGRHIQTPTPEANKRMSALLAIAWLFVSASGRGVLSSPLVIRRLCLSGRKRKRHQSGRPDVIGEKCHHHGVSPRNTNVREKYIIDIAVETILLFAYPCSYHTAMVALSGTAVGIERRRWLPLLLLKRPHTTVLESSGENGCGEAIAIPWGNNPIVMLSTIGHCTAG